MKEHDGSVMMSIEDAVAALCEAAPVLTKIKYVPVAGSFGRICANDVFAPKSLPSF